MFGRFLEPIQETLIQKDQVPPESKSSTGSEFLLQFGNCSKCAQRLNSRSTMSARRAAAPTHRAAVNKLLRFRASNCSYLPIRLN
jgi:hypothetical protein